MNELCEGVEYRVAEFPKVYTKIVYIAENEINWSTNNDIVFRLFNDNFSDNNTVRINYWYELVQERYQFIFYQCERILIPNKLFMKLFPKDIYNKLICYAEFNTLPKYVKQYFISNNVKHVEKQFIDKMQLNKKFIYNTQEPCFFFGIYNSEDIGRLKSHKGEKHIIFGGSDLDKNIISRSNIVDIIYKICDKSIYYISKNLRDRGVEYNLHGTLVKLDLVPNDWNIEIDLENLKLRESIYCYTGCGRLGKLYNHKMLLELEVLLPEFNFIYSHNLNMEFSKMREIYNKCFVGVRLTNKDGNANTVLEMGSLGIPVIFNGNEVNSISYKKDVNDIRSKILSIKNLS